MLATRLAEIHFAATDGNVANLLNEGVSEKAIYKTGNTVIDALMMVIKEDFVFEEAILNQLDYENRKVILVTAHRRENLGEPMENIFGAIRKIVEDFEDVEVVFPIHMNPAVRMIADRHLSGHDRIHMIEPLEYGAFANMIGRSTLILTDSGGIQEEAPAIGKPVVVLRTETERPEAVEAGTVAIAGVSFDAIYNITAELLKDASKYRRMSEAVNPYGDGKACARIVEAIKSWKKD